MEEMITFSPQTQTDFKNRLCSPTANNNTDFKSTLESSQVVKVWIKMCFISVFHILKTFEVDEQSNMVQ